MSKHPKVTSFTHGLLVTGVLGSLVSFSVVSAAMPPVPPAAPSSSLPSSLAAAAYAFTQSLKSGSSGADVTALQTRLQTEGVYGGPITGYFGPMTETAVKAFQLKYGLEQAGVVGPMTLARLNTQGNTPTTVPNPPINTPTMVGGVPGVVTFMRSLKLGATGADVTALQTRLQTEGVYGGPITGYFGPMTETAVKAFQLKYGLEQAGVVGPMTLQKLNGQASPAVPPTTASAANVPPPPPTPPSR